jgi:hypothetical protein
MEAFIDMIDGGRNIEKNISNMGNTYKTAKDFWMI